MLTLLRSTGEWGRIERKATELVDRRLRYHASHKVLAFFFLSHISDSMNVLMLGLSCRMPGGLVANQSPDPPRNRPRERLC